MAINYGIMLDRELSKIKVSGATPELLLHSCCAPCSSYVLEYLSRFFAITVLYYNPNIYPRGEFEKRAAEQLKLPQLMEYENPVRTVVCEYNTEEFDSAVISLENEPEGGGRCEKCFELRLREAADRAKTGGYDYFTTTLSVSPHKDAALLNSIGERLAGEYGVKYLYADFKKNDGYKRSVFLSRRLGLYRQDYCGCKYSRPYGGIL